MSQPSSPVSWLSPKNDFVFKLLFGSNTKVSKELLLAFLNDVLNVPQGQSLANVEILNPIMNKQSLTDKLVILDVKAKAVGYGFVNVEIQLTNQRNIHKRSLYYASKLIEGQLGEGEDYRKLTRVVSINLLDFPFFSADRYRYTYRLMEERTHENFFDMMQLYYFELPKFVAQEREGHKNPEDRMEKWLSFLTNEDDSRWGEMAKKEPIIKKAVDVLKEASVDPETRILYEAREKALKDMASIYGDGVEEGREEGRKEGKNEGKLEGKQEIVKYMLQKGMGVEEIAELTGLSESEVSDIKRHLEH